MRFYWGDSLLLRLFSLEIRLKMRFAKKDFKYTQLLLVNGYEKFLFLSLPSLMSLLSLMSLKKNVRDVRDRRDDRDKYTQIEFLI
jgi:hypothetical protein